MCGIAGEWDWSGRQCERSAVSAMIGSLVHRGPEGHECWFDLNGEIALAYARLSFFNRAKAQPVSNTRNSIFVVCNGEIYNHQELVALIRQSGMTVPTRS